MLLIRLRTALEAVVAADVQLMELRAEEKHLNEQLQVCVRGGVGCVWEGVTKGIACRCLARLRRSI